jgi:cytochrome c
VLPASKAGGPQGTIDRHAALRDTVAMLIFFGSAQDVPQRTMGGFVLRWGMVAIALGCAVSGQAVAQDVAAGEKAFAICRACHQIGPAAKDAIGPVLNGVVGRKAGTYPGYSYSEANRDSGLTWDEETLQKYLADPQAVVKGTKMIFPGYKDPAKVNDVIAFLKTFAADGTRVK